MTTLENDQARPICWGGFFLAFVYPYEAKQKETQEDVPGIDSRCL